MAAALLVLTDFSHSSNQAVSYAAALAAPLGANLVLLHVQRDSLLDPELLTGESNRLDAEAVNLAFDSLVRDFSVPVLPELGYGQVADAAAAAIRQHQPLLLVLGRPDNTADLPDELITTTALGLLRTAPYPMLVVPHTVSATTLPRRILLAVDGEEFSLGQHAGAMRHLLDALHAELTVLHVTDTPRPDEQAAALAIVQRTGLTADLAQPIRSLSSSAPTPADGILQAAKPQDFDLLVLIARPRSFLGELFHHSVTAQVLLHSAVPVLVLPATE
jgi:nucleotide-binding universal stress UspA family protein